jgi:hypothetical protein
MVTKPPLGLMPRWRWLELRRDAILDAMHRYRCAGKDVPEAWLAEFVALVAEIVEEHKRRSRRL